MGYYSIMSSDYGFDKIYSFEPIPKMINRIQKNVEINNLKKLIKIIPFALGEQNKEVSLYQEPSLNVGTEVFADSLSESEHRSGT